MLWVSFVILFSSNRPYDKVYTKLRLGHSRLGLHCAYKGWICTRCSDFEDGMHALFECAAYAEQRRDMEAKIFKLGYTQVTYDLLLNPPSKHRQDVVQAEVVFLEDTECLDKI